MPIKTYSRFYSISFISVCHYLSHVVRLLVVFTIFCWFVVVVVVVFNVPQTTEVIWRRGHGLKSHPTDW